MVGQRWIAVICFAFNMGCGAAPAQAQQTAPMSNPVFAQPVTLRGRLGGDVVQMQLQPKKEDMDSVEGSYFVFGGKRNHGNRILLAGEVSRNKVSMEESEDGVDVSGQWDGELNGTTFRGVWQSDDGKLSLDFSLELVSDDRKPMKKIAQHNKK